MSSVLGWEFERDGRAESDGGQRTERSSPDIRAIFVCRKFRSGPVTLEAAGVFHIAQRLGRSPLPTLPASASPPSPP